jgi:CNT family concentrative nucleoside transporter
MQSFQPILGMVFMVGLCLLLSRNRREALRQWRIVVWGFGLQFGLALLILGTSFGEGFFFVVNNVFQALLGYASDGAQFVFGDLADPERKIGPENARQDATIVAFAVLTTIVFFASLLAVLYHLGIMQRVVKATAWIMARTMGTSGSESLVAAANIFVGMTESPYMVRPFVPGMTRSELMAVMTVGFSTIAGGVMALYCRFLENEVPDIAGHLMTASIMSAPAGLVFAKLLYPETVQSQTAGTIRVRLDSPYDNVVDAAAGGASEGMKLMINVVAMLIAFVGLVAMANGIFAFLSDWLYDILRIYGIPIPHGTDPLTVQKIFGWLFSPLAWLMGVPAGESVEVGQLLGTKTILN